MALRNIRLGSVKGSGQAKLANRGGVKKQQLKTGLPTGAYVSKTTKLPTGVFAPKTNALPRPYQVPKLRPLEPERPQLDHTPRLPNGNLETMRASKSSDVAWLLEHRQRAIIVDGGIKNFMEAVPKVELEHTRLRVVELDARTLPNGESNLRVVLDKVVKSLREQGVEVPNPKPGEGFYEYFRRNEAPELWTEDNYIARPVVVFRHFEEFLKQAGESPHRWDVIELAGDSIPKRILKLPSAQRKTINLRKWPDFTLVFSLEKELTQTAAATLKRGLLTEEVYRFTP